MNLNIFKKTSQKGFTLIEMIVSLAIFTIVAVVAIGALLKILDTNKKTINLKNATNNINFALESMSRELRVGSGYKTTNASGGDWTIEFRSSKSDETCNVIYAYKYDSANQTIQKAQSSPSSCNEVLGSYQDLISSDVKITSSSVSLDKPYGSLALIGIYLSGYAGVKEKDKTYFSIRTSVSQLSL